jgi:hypothetical protein
MDNFKILASLLFLHCASDVFVLLISLYYRFYWASFLITFLSAETATRLFLFFIITHYDVRFNVRNTSVGLHLLVS